MKKLTTIFVFLLAAMAAFSQFSSTQYLGTASTMIEMRGGGKADSGFVVGNFFDTTIANLGVIKNIPGIEIRIGNTRYYRNSAASGWIQYITSINDADSIGWANVVSYGAIPNDGLEDSVAIKAAIATGKTVYFPPGVFTTAAKLVVNDGQVITGLNWTSVLHVTSTWGNVSTDANYEAFVIGTGCTIENMTIEGTGRDVSWAGNYPIQSAIRVHGDRNLILNVQTRNMKGAAVFLKQTVGFAAFYGNQILNLRAVSNTLGYYNFYYGQYTNLIASRIDSCAYAVLEYGNNNSIDGCMMNWNDHAADFNTVQSGNDHGFIKGTSWNHSGDISFTNLAFGYEITACELWFTNIVCTNSDNVMFSQCTLGNISVSVSGTGTKKGTQFIGGYTSPTITFTSTGTGYIFKSGVKDGLERGYKISSQNGIAYSDIEVADSVLFFRPFLGAWKVDSVNNIGTVGAYKVLMWDSAGKTVSSVLASNIAANLSLSNLASSVTTTGVTSFSFAGAALTNYNATYNAQTGTSYTLQSTDAGKIITLSNASAITLTIPSGLPAGFTCTVIQTGAGQVTFTASSTTINNSGGFTKTRAQYSAVGITQYTTNTFITQGDMI